uniref:ZP domain-containing protein n=1 Tax=Salmo trutta TaxID=8032 RepID=A0A673XZK7_SALTR
MPTWRFYSSTITWLVCCVGLCIASGPNKCCFTFAERQIPRGRVVGYTKTSQQCLKEINNLCIEREKSDKEVKPCVYFPRMTWTSAF